jgi:hypothetical protein
MPLLATRGAASARGFGFSSAAAAAAADPYFNYTTLLLPGTGTNGATNSAFLDSSANNFAITRNGNTTQGTFSPFSQTGWSNYFGATGHYLSVPYSSAFNLPGDFTIECWINPGNLPSTGGAAPQSYARIFSFGAVEGLYNLGLSIESQDSNSIRKLYIRYTNILYTVSNNNAVTPGVWYHIAIVRSAATITTYINGTSTGLTILNASATINTNQSFYIASLQNYESNSQFAFNGYISNLRILKNQALYNGNFTPATSALTANAVGATGAGAAQNITGTVSLLTCQSNRFVDNSSNNFALTVSGTPSVQAFSPFAPTVAYSPALHGGSAYFDGTGDYLTAASTSGQLGAGNFTFECWIYLLARTSNYPCIFSNYSAFTTTSFGLFAAFQGYTTKYTLAVNNVHPAIQSTDSIVYNSWTHLAVVRSASTITLYVNGIANGTTNVSATLNGTSGTSWIGGAGTNTADAVLHGYLSSLRIALNSAIYTENFTLPTAPLTAITNTSLLLNFTNAGIKDATAKNILETVDGAQISTAQSKWGSGSMLFNGNGGYLYAENTRRSLEILAGDFTIECWINFNVVGNGQIITGLAATNTLYWQYYSSQLQFGQNNVATLTATNWSPSSGVWYHLAVTRSGSTLRQFVSGNQLGSTATSSASFANGPIHIGNGGAGFLNGYISDLRITKGYARYTANFNVPTAPFALL